jgi:DNA (cytosine-5)-methyltransferase 1
MKEIKIGGQFSGVGAFDTALNRLKIPFKNIYQAEWDKYARKTYLANNEQPEYYVEDVNDTPIEEITENHGSLDIVMFSPPCQAFSLAGKRLGKNDPKGRGILFFNSLEFIEKNKPRFFIFENVKGLLSDDGGNTFNEWLNYLGGKSVNGSGVLFAFQDSVPYHIYWKVLNAKDYGVPQNRERVFIIGIRDDQDNNFTFPPEEPLAKRLKDVLEPEVDEKYYLSDKTINYIKKREGVYTDFNPPFARTLCSQYSQSANGSYIEEECKFGFYTCCNIGIMCNDCDEGCNYEMIEEPKIIKKGFINQDTQASQVYDSDGLSPTLNTMQGGNRQPFIEEPKICAMRGRNIENPKSRKSGQPTQQMIEVNENGVSNSLTTVQKDNLVVEPKVIQLNPSKESGGKQPYQHNRVYDINGIMTTLDTDSGRKNILESRIRKLTPIECFRLMDFPDSLVENARKAGVSDSQLYKQAGNSIVVAVLEKLINRLKL